MTQNPVNRTALSIIELADRNGWTVIEYSGSSIRLQGPPSTFLMVTVEAEFGIGLAEFLDTLRAPVYERAAPTPGGA